MPESLPRRLSASQTIGWIVGLAAAAGLGESALSLASQAQSGRVSLFGPEALWLRPLGELGAFLPLGALYLAVSLPIRSLRRPEAVLAAFGTLGGLAVAGAVEGLHWASAALLAVGFGVSLARSPRIRRARPWHLAAALLGLVTLIGLGQWTTSASWRKPMGRDRVDRAGAAPNVLLLVLDTARAWNFGWLGHSRATTPSLDAWVGSGAIFTKALAAAPWTLPSHASLFTGRLPTELSANWQTALDDEAPTLAEALSAAGYATGGFVANYRYTGRSTGLARGFQHYDDYPVRWDETLRMLSLVRRALRWPRAQQWLGEHRVLEARDAADVNDAFLRWVGDGTGGPFFGFLNYVDAHSPYLPPAPFDSMWIQSEDQGRGARRYAVAMERAFGPGPIPPELLAEYFDGYDGALRYLDAEITRLFDELRRRGLLDNTIVVLTSDHGEHFGEHHLIQHGNSLFLPLLHVPLVLSWPGHVPAGSRVTTPVSLRNVAATVLDLAGVPGQGVAGRSLTARWLGGDAGGGEGVDTVVSAVDWHPTLSKFPPSPLLLGSLRSVVLDSLHLIVRSDGTEELFDPDRDFLERLNLARLPAYQGELSRLRGALEAMTGGDHGPSPRAN